MQSKIQKWKIRQDMVLTIFLNTWFTLSQEQKADMPVQILLGDPNALVSREGQILCEYTMKGSMPYARWYRTVEDYEYIDELGQTYGNTEATGDDESTRDGGGVETET
jgi:hypothetical protein